MLFKKRGVFIEEDVKKVVEWMGVYFEEKEFIVMVEVVENIVKRRLWDFVRVVKFMVDMIGEEREVRVEIFEGFVSEKVKGIDVEEL